MRAPCAMFQTCGILDTGIPPAMKCDGQATPCNPLEPWSDVFSLLAHKADHPVKGWLLLEFHKRDHGVVDNRIDGSQHSMTSQRCDSLNMRLPHRYFKLMVSSSAACRTLDDRSTGLGNWHTSTWKPRLRCDN